MLKISIPSGFQPELLYIIETIFQDFFSVPAVIDTFPNCHKIVVVEYVGKKLILPQILLGNVDGNLFNIRLPLPPLEQIELLHENIPVQNFCGNTIPILYGERTSSERWISRTQKTIRCDVDILGGIFFMLTRLEETSTNVLRDLHGRFPTDKTLSFREGFHDRPIANEYLELLWHLMEELWPNLTRKGKQFKMHISHDIDFPFKWPSFGKWARYFAALTLKHREPLKGLLSCHHYIQYIRGKKKDPYDTYDYLMNMSERYSIISEFYFMVECGGHGIHTQQNIRLLSNKIFQRGHAIGFHPSYESFDNPSVWRQELQILCSICKKHITTGRQHFLRFHPKITWPLWDQSGMTHDSSVGYPDTIGFRSGICYEYPVYNFLERKKISLKEVPLIVMDGALKKANKDYSSTLKNVFELKEKIKKYNGVFSVLWHNSSLNSYEWNGWPQIYEQILRY